MPTYFISRIVALFLAIFLLSAPSYLSSSEANDGEELLPNFVVIMVDDLGAMDLGCYGNNYIRTPNIDQLAKDGVLATRAYAAAAICSPTRAAWITGRHPARLGITDWIRARFQRPEATDINVPRSQFDTNPRQLFQTPSNPFYLPLSEITVAEIVKKRGYRTAHIGKWHLGDDEWYPEHQGYDVNKGGCDYGQPPTYFDPYLLPNAKHESLRTGIPGIKGRKAGEFLTERETAEAIDLMKQWKDSPFYIQLNHYAVHTPIEAPSDLTEYYRQPGKNNQQAKYAALLETVDRGVGQLRTAIGELKMNRPTIIVFTSDNGGLDQNGSPTNNAPLRDGKGTPYEGGLRVPLIFFGDGVFPGNRILDAPICSLDWLPTLCALTNQENPDNVILDGINLLPLLKAHASPTKPRRLTWHFPHYRGETLPYSVLQAEDWKLIHTYGAPPELYHLDKDPFETTNLSQVEKEKLSELTVVLFEELKRLNASLPKEK
jgi:arylsulfatase A